MLRRFALAVAALGIVACSNCDAPCKSGITFNVAEIGGALSAGSQLPLHVCFDTTCDDVTITRNNESGTVFLDFPNVNKAGDHKISVSSSKSAIKGEYNGPLYTYTQKPGSDCKTCFLSTVKISPDGTIVPGQPAPSPTTIAGPTTTAGNG
jgi:hypothetical protein